MDMRWNQKLVAAAAFAISAIALASTHSAPVEDAEPIVVGHKVRLHSTILDEDRTLLVRLPEGYESGNQRYSVLYLLDAEYFFEQATAAVQFLSECGYIQEQPIPKLIVIGVVNVDRNRDFTPTHAPEQGTFRFPTSGGADRFKRFLEEELIPNVDRRYRTGPHRILCGWSFGGLFTVHTYLSQPGLFSSYLAVSPSLWWDRDLLVGRAKEILPGRRDPERSMVVTLGAAEGGDMGRSVRDGFAPLVQPSARSRLRISFIEIPDEGHEYVPYKAMLEGLRATFPDWRIPPDVADRGREAIVSHYQELSRKFRYQVDMPVSVMTKVANVLYQTGDGPAALETASLCVKMYPDSSRAHFVHGLFQERLGHLEAALRCYRQAIDIENLRNVPYSEEILSYESAVARVEAEMGAGTADQRCTNE